MFFLTMNKPVNKPDSMQSANGKQPVNGKEPIIRFLNSRHNGSITGLHNETA